MRLRRPSATRSAGSKIRAYGWANAKDIDPKRGCVILDDGEACYDTLVLAPGSHHSYFGHDEWGPLAPALKTIEDATEIRRRILLAFEYAEREADAEKRRQWLSFVIVGGGPTGVELAGALGEIANDTLRHDFRNINPAEARILLVEGEERVLPTFPPDLAAKAERDLVKLGVQVRNRSRVTALDADGVAIRMGESVVRFPAKTVLWAAGVASSGLGKIVAQRTGAPLDKAGRVIVQPDLTVPGHPEIFVIGDLANFSHQTGKPLGGIGGGGYAGGPLRGAGDHGTSARGDAGTFPLPGQRHPCDHRPQQSRGGFRALSSIGTAGVVRMAIRPPDVPGGIREPGAGAGGMGVRLRDPESQRAADYR